jgi:hypothetical protein
VTLEVRLALALLATYRVAQMVAIDDGPLCLFARLRAWAGAHGSDLVRENLGALVHCPYCVGVWAAALCALLVLWPTGVGDLALMILGIAGGQAFLQGPRDAAED